MTCGLLGLIYGGGPTPSLYICTHTLGIIEQPFCPSNVIHRYENSEKQKKALGARVAHIETYSHIKQNMLC
jgi:hypothetical protein